MVGVADASRRPRTGLREGGDAVTNRMRIRTVALLAVLLTLMTALGCGREEPQPTADVVESSSDQKEMTLEEYLDTTTEQWFLTGKKRYTVQAMMVSKETSFHNDLEVVDYTVTDDDTTVILKGTAGEMWATDLSKVIATYTKPDGSELSKTDFDEKDVYIDIVSIPTPGANYAMFVPQAVTVTVETAWGDVLHTNLPNAPHGNGDYLVCRVGDDHGPDLSDVWVLNGAIFPDTYYTKHLVEDGQAGA